MREEQSEKRTGKEDPRQELRERIRQIPIEKLTWLDGFIYGMVFGTTDNGGGERSDIPSA